MSEVCPNCDRDVHGAVKLRADSFVLVCPLCYHEFSPPERKVTDNSITRAKKSPQRA